MAKLKTALGPRDSVEQRAVDFVAKLRGRLKGAESQYVKAKKAGVDFTGDVRPASITHAAEKFVQIEILKERVEAAEAGLKAAQDDFPRREQCRKDAEAADKQADKLDSEAATVREQLVKLEGQSAAKRSEAASHRHAASRTAAVLERTPPAEAQAAANRAADEAKAGHLAAMADTRARQFEVRRVA